MADGTSAADAEHDEGALRDAEEKMQVRPDGTEETDEGKDPLDAGHDEGALHDAEEKMLLRNDDTD
jgi:hypothetical protein